MYECKRPDCMDGWVPMKGEDGTVDVCPDCSPPPSGAAPAAPEGGLLLARRLSPQAKLPTRAHAQDVGLDLYSHAPVLLNFGEAKAVDLGVAVAVPPGHVGLVVGRSGLAAQGVDVLGGVIDPGYTGPLKAILCQVGAGQTYLPAGARVAQLLVLPVAYPGVREVGELPGGDRGGKGLGSTGV